MNDETDEAVAGDEPLPVWCHPMRAKDMLGMTAFIVRNLLVHDHDALHETYGIRADAAEQSLHYVELAELRVWGVDEMLEAALPGQSFTVERLRRRIELALKAEGVLDLLHPGDAVLLLERSGLMLIQELREAVVCMSTRSYAEDGIDFSLEDENRLRRLVGKPSMTADEEAAWLSDGNAVASVPEASSGKPDSPADLEQVAKIPGDTNQSLDDIAFEAAFSESVNNGQPISWRYWVQDMPVWTAAQAARLMCALDPDIFEHLDRRPNNNDPSDLTSKAKQIQRLAEAQGRTSLTPAQWIEWADLHQINVHTWLRIEVNSLSSPQGEKIQPVDGKLFQMAESNPIAPPSASRKNVVHNLKNRSHVLDNAMELAIAAVDGKSDYQAVWAAYAKLARSPDRPAPLLGYVEGEGVKYTSDTSTDGTAFDTKRNFAARFARRQTSR